MENKRKYEPDDPEQSSRFIQLANTTVANGEPSSDQDEFGMLIEKIAPAAVQKRTPRIKKDEKPRGKKR